MPILGAPGGTLVSRGAEQRALDPIESALLTLLERHPTALVFAILGEGVPKPVPVPDTVPAWGHEFVDAERKLMDEIIPADRVLVAKLWGQARTQGAAVANVRLVSDPDQASNLYLLDVRPQHGVMVGLYTPGVSSDGDPIVEAARLPMLPPRVARAVKDTSAVITWVDPALSLILGWTPEELIGQRTIEFVHPDDRELGIATWMEMLESSESTRPVRLRHRHRDGSWVWLEVTNTRRYGDGDGDVLSEMLDVSEEMATVDALRAREQLLGQLTETVPVGLFHMDLSGNLLFANRRLHQMIGTSSEPRLVDQLAQLEPEDRIKLLAAVNAAAAGAETDVAVRVLPDEGGMRHCAISIRPLRDDHATVTGLTGCVEDVTDSVRSRTELEAKAISDPLTGCLNRAATLAVLQEALDCVTLAETNPTGTAVIFVDLDRFKPVNDQYGHAAGDEILIRVAERIRGAVRSGDVVGRLGGDEFLVICPRVADPETALAIAYSLTARSFGSRFDLEGTSLEIRASLGVAWSNVRGTHAAGLVAEADAAMYRSKRDGRAKPVMFIDPPLAAPPSEGPDAAVQSARSA